MSDRDAADPPRQLKVCVICSARPDVSPHGIELAAWQYCLGLAHAGWQVHLVYDADQGEAGGTPPDVDGILWHGVRADTGNRFRRRVQFLRGAAQAVRELDRVDDLDLVAVHGLELSPIALGLRGVGPKVLHHAASAWEEMTHFGLRLLRERNALAFLHYAQLTAYEPFIYRWYDMVVKPAVSTAGGLRSSSRRTIDRKTVVVPYGHSIVVDAEADAVESTVDEKRILAIGNNWERKGHDTLLRALPGLLARVPCTLRIVMREQPELTRLAESLGLRVGTDVVFTGNLSRQDLLDEFSRCDVFALASRYEGYSITTLEALAAGKPAVVSPIVASYNPALTEGANGLVVDAEDVDGWTESLGGVLLSTERQLAMGQAASRAAAMFTWERVSQQLDASYRGLVQAKG